VGPELRLDHASPVELDGHHGRQLRLGGQAPDDGQLPEVQADIFAQKVSVRDGLAGIQQRCQVLLDEDLKAGA
jgi:hypothetical protein